MQVHKGTKETKERQVKPQLLKGKRVNLVRTAPMVWMGLVEKKAREVPPDLRAMLDFKDSKVIKGILVKMVALAYLVRWVLLEILALLEIKERTVQLASLDPPVIQVVKAFQASQVNREILDLLAKLELKENQD